MSSLVAFFIPLQRPMAIEPSERFYGTLDSNLPWLRSFEWPEELASLGRAVGDSDFVAFTFYQRLGMMTIDMRPYTRAFEMASHWTNYEYDPNDTHNVEDQAAGDSEPNAIEETIVVAITSFEAGNTSTEAVLYSALEKSLAELSLLEQGYMAATRDLRYRPITRRSAFPYCVVSVWSVEEKSWSPPSLFAVNMSMGIVVSSEIISGRVVEKLKVSWIRNRQKDPWLRYIMASIDAQRALEVDGDFGQSVARAYTAAEILLDTVWTCMAWEEITYNENPDCQATVETVKSWFSIKSTLDTRLARCFHGRLIGWDTENAKTPAYWLRYGVSKLRHRVIHAGYIPTESEAQYSIGLCAELEEYMKDLLVRDVNRNRHPRTALLWMGIPGLQRRGKFKGKVKRLTEIDDEENWVDSFVAFRHQIDRELGYLDIDLPI